MPVFLLIVCEVCRCISPFADKFKRYLPGSRRNKLLKIIQGLQKVVNGFQLRSEGDKIPLMRHDRRVSPLPKGVSLLA